MNRFPTMEDLFEGEDDLLGCELFEALAPLRPDPEEFRRAIAARIREDGAGDRSADPTADPTEDPAADPAEISATNRSDDRSERLAPDAANPQKRDLRTTGISSFARRAAAFIPPVLLPKSLAKLGLGGALAGKASFKFLPGLLAFPVISLLMIFVTLGLGLRTLFHSKELVESQAPHEAQHAIAKWWQRYWIPVFVVILLSAWVNAIMPNDGLVLFYMLSTLALLGLFAKLSNAGLTTRREVGRLAAGAILWVLGLSFQFEFGPRNELGGHFAMMILPSILIVAALTCWDLAKGRPQSVFRLVRRTVLTLTVLSGVLYAFWLWAPGKMTADSRDIRRWIETRAETDRIRDIALALANLEAAGQGPFDLTHLKSKVRKRLDAEYAAQSFNPLNAPAMIRLGFFEERDFERLRDESRIQHLLKLIPGYKQSLFLDLGASEPYLLARLHFKPFTAEQRAVLSKKILANLEPEDRYTSPEDMRRAALMLEAIGSSEQLRSMEAAVRQVLLATFSPTAEGSKACFVPFRESIARDEDGQPTQSKLTFISVRSTATAVWLMKRFGVPSEVDLTALDAYLADESVYWAGLGISPYTAEAVSSRALLHTLPGWKQSRPEPATSWIESLISMRGLLAAILLAGFAVTLTLRARPEPEGKAHGV